MVCMLEKAVALAKALDVPPSALFSFDQDEADPKMLNAQEANRIDSEAQAEFLEPPGQMRRTLHVVSSVRSRLDSRGGQLSFVEVDISPARSVRFD
jgi:hypothetical protein